MKKLLRSGIIILFMFIGIFAEQCYCVDFGYFGTANSDVGTGNYIAELSGASNIATISPPSDDAQNVDYVIDLIIESHNNGMKSVIWVDHLFFYIDWDSPEKELYLYPDYQERWNRYATKIAPYINLIHMFYVLDEPYWNGSQAQISDADMLIMLETVGVTIKRTFPRVNVGNCFGGLSDVEIPISYTLVGFDYYYDLSEDINLYFNKYRAYLSFFKTKMYPHQKLFMVPGGFQFVSNPVPQNELIYVAHFFQELFLCDPRAEMMIVFLYPPISGVTGLKELPWVMAKYEEIGYRIKTKAFQPLF